MVIAFWDRAQHDDRMPAVHEGVMAQWRRQMHRYLREAREAGEVTAAAPDRLTVDTLLTTLMGFQINALLDARETTRRRQEAVLEGLLSALA